MIFLELLGIRLLIRDELLDLKRRHTARARRRDRLTVALVLHITGGEDSVDGRLGGTRYGDNVPIRVRLKLVTHDGGCRLVTWNGRERSYQISSGEEAMC